MLIKDLLASEKTLAVEFASGSSLQIKYRPSSYTVSDISNIDEEAKKDPYRIITMVRDMLVDWDLESAPGVSVPIELPPGSGNFVTTDGEQVKTKLDKQKLMETDPISIHVPIFVLVAIVRAINDDQSAGN